MSSFATPISRVRRFNSVRIWTWAAVAISVATCLAIAWLHLSQREAVSSSSRLLSGLREARIQLAQGFLHLTLSGDATSPFSREQGMALIDQATDTLQTAESEFAASTAVGKNSVLLTDFDAKLKDFQKQLMAYSSGTPAARRDLELPLRFSYHDLDQFAQRVDLASQDDLHTLMEQQHERFEFALVSAIALMGLMCAGVYEVGRRQAMAVTALRASEEKLKETNQFLTDLIEHSSAVIFVKDKAGRYELVNCKWEEVTGTRRERAIGQDDSVLFPGAIGNQFSENDRKVLVSGQSLEVEETLADPAGERTFLSVKFPVRDDDDSIRGVCGMSTDVTERKRASETLKRQSAVLASVNRVLSLGLGRETEEEMCMACLEVVESITGSRMSFIGEIGADGMMHDLAVSNPTWDVCKMRDQTGHRKPPGNFRLHGILGRVLNEGQSLIANDPAHYPGRTGFPEGHPPLMAFLGVPLKRDGQTIGMIAVGNRPGGYSQDEQHDLEVLAPVILEALDRKRAEAAVRASEASLESFLNTAAAGLVRNSRDVRYRSVNTAYARMVNRPVDQIVGRTLAEVLGEQALANLQPYIDRVLAGERVAFESAMPMADKPHCWINAVYMPDFGPDGEIVGWVGSITDITDRKQAEEERAQLAAIVESSEDAIVGKNLNGIVTSWNQGAEKLFGYSAVEMIGQPVLKLFPPERVTEEPKILARLQRGELVEHFETQRITKSGRRLDVSVAISPIRDASGRIVGASKIARDITASKAAEAEIRHQAGLIRSLLDSIPDLIFYKDPQGVFLGGNPAFADFLGRPLEEIIGKTDYDLFPKELADMFRANDRKMQETLQSRRNEEWVDYANGKRVLLDTLKTPYWGTDGKSLGVLGVSRDITEAKLAQKKILELNRTLEQRVQERTAELRASNEELDAFVYAVSHDLRAPLRAMNGFSQALREDFAPHLPPEAGEYLDFIQNGSREMGGLIDGLLRLSRVTRGELDFHTVDISALANRVLSQLKQDDPGRDITCTVEPGLSTSGDARLLEIVLTNLLSNAWKYTSAKTQASIRVFGQIENGYATFAVADNGAGFDMKHAARLFQPFQRLHRDDEFPGLGIGLATVQRIARRHGGQIQAQSAPGQGATFTLKLPILKPYESTQSPT